MIISKIYAAKSAKIKSYPCNANRASSLGHECLRNLVYCRTNWQDKKLHDAKLQLIFDIGNEFEQIVFKELAEAGLQVIEQQRSFELKQIDGKDCNITGHIDGRILLDNKLYPLEIKSMSPYAFDSIQDEESIRKHKSGYLRGYLTQINLYIQFCGTDEAIFLAKNKSTGEYKEILIKKDHGLIDKTILKCCAIEEYLKLKELPERCNDDNICNDCPFSHICLPDVKREELQIINDFEIEQMIARYFELKDLAKEYNSINDHLKEFCNGRDKLLVGDYLITGKPINKKEYIVKASTSWQKKIEKLGE